jgi:uncharacterized protein YutE (UPF0331/DUF86 family)
VSDKKTNRVKDSVHLQDNVNVVRYKGSIQIMEMIKNQLYVEAFTHCQLAIEKILFDKIAILLKKRIELEVKHGFRSYELIKWSYLLGVIDENDYRSLLDFNKARNRIIHGYGYWWETKKFKQNLQKGIKFIKTNGM